MLWKSVGSVAALAGVLLMLVACGGNARHSPTAAARPAGVSGSASLVTGDATFGSPDSGGQELFFSTGCSDGVLNVVTNQHIIYAELPCDRALPASVSERFLGKPLRIRLVVATPSKIYLDSTIAGSVEFTVGQMWLAQ